MNGTTGWLTFISIQTNYAKYIHKDVVYLELYFCVVDLNSSYDIQETSYDMQIASWFQTAKILEHL